MPPHNQAALQFSASTGVLLSVVVFLLLGAGVLLFGLRGARETRRRERDIAQRDTSAHHSQLVNQLPVALFSWQPGLGFATVSEGISRILPLTASEAVGDTRRFLATLNPDDACALEPVFLGNAQPAATTWLGRTLPRSDGSVAWLQLSASTMVTGEGKPGLIGLLMDVTPLKSAQLELEEAQYVLRRLAAKREADLEAERLRLAREFHDELGQILTGARMRLQRVSRSLDPEHAAPLTEIEAMLASAYQSAKNIAATLRPPVLNLGLASAIEWLVERSFDQGQMRVTLSLREPNPPLDEAASIALFRIAQESLTNIVKYAQAKSVHVSLRTDAHSQVLVIADDGIGFEPGAVDPRTHFGLAGMRERLWPLQGELDIDSAPGEGTRLTVTLPIAARGAFND